MRRAATERSDGLARRRPSCDPQSTANEAARIPVKPHLAAHDRVRSPGECGRRYRAFARGLRDAALAGMRRRGVRMVEAFPGTATREGGRVAPGVAYTGPTGIFENEGGDGVQRLSKHRPLVRLRRRRG